MEEMTFAQFVREEYDENEYPIIFGYINPEEAQFIDHFMIAQSNLFINEIYSYNPSNFSRYCGSFQYPLLEIDWDSYIEEETGYAKISKERILIKTPGCKKPKMCIIKEPEDIFVETYTIEETDNWDWE